jgi:cobalt-zinc-cadmium efflux system outer membrane protein
MNKIELSFLLLVLGVTCIAAESLPLHIDDVIAEAITNNPEIRVLRSLQAAAHARTSVLRQMPDPQIGIEFDGNGRMYSMTQQIPFPGKLVAGRAVARASAEEYDYLIAQKEQDIVTRVKKTYALLYRNHMNVRALERSVVNLEQIYLVASRQYAVGAASQAHVLRTQVELARAEEQLRVQKDEVSLAEAQLNTLLDRPVNTRLGMPASIEVQIDQLSYDSLIELARRSQPYLQVVRQEVKLAEQQVAAARQHYFPDMMLKMTQIDRDMDVSDQKFMFGITVPLWFIGKQNEMVREAVARLDGAKARYQAQENTERLHIYEVYVLVQSRDRTVRLLEDAILPQAEANLRAALTAYETNQINFQNLLDSEKLLIGSEMEYYKAQAELFSAAADLDKAVGIELILKNKE